ncbi:dihydrodipicolinate synthase family protein [Rhodovulum sulfidophilum]|nr:dihydrodipicolinate synthase family protein [Rhodovulum sulfidophilum]
MTSAEPRRAYVATVTCFNDDETLNLDQSRAQVRRQVEAGNDILCAGTNGDFTALLFDEKLSLIEAVLAEAAGRARVMVNVGAPSTFETVRLARAAADLGVDCVSVITPYFIACTQEGLRRHFEMVADAVDVPVYLYDIPARTQNHIEPDTALTLARHGNICGIKDSGGSQKTLEEYLEVSRQVEGFGVWSGPDQLVLWALKNGAAGAISGLGNVAPHLLAGIVRAFNAGDMEAAEAAQARFGALRTDLYALGYPPAVAKRALYLTDPGVGASRQPALMPDAAQDAAIRDILDRHDLAATV